MFPAQAGMNRSCGRWWGRRTDVPRAGGDEPFAPALLARAIICSPRRRG